jgi:hypothetical protein
MNFHWQQRHEKGAISMFRSDRRLYLTADRSQVVEEGDPRAALLLVCKGGTLDEKTAKQYGLIKEEAPPEPEPPAVEPEPESKAIEGPPENKAITAAPATKDAKSKKK